MPTQHKIAQLGHPVLRKIASPVDDWNAPEIQTLCDDLIETMMSSDGVGIAAPQIDRSVQVMVVASRPNARYPHAPMMEPTIMINPLIKEKSKQMLKDWEGCLSVPGIRGLVPRHQSISMTYTDRNGGKQEVSYSDFIARVVQHEYDHLHGFSYLDRVEDNRDLISEQEYFRLYSDHP